MNATQHSKERMAQRGISRSMVKYVLMNGTCEQDKVMIGKREALRMLEDLRNEERLLKRILDKGGIVVVAEGNTVITTYNRRGRGY